MNTIFPTPALLSLVLLTACGGNTASIAEPESDSAGSLSADRQSPKTSVATSNEPVYLAEEMVMSVVPTSQAAIAPLVKKMQPAPAEQVSRELTVYDTSLPATDSVTPDEDRENYAEVEISGIYQVSQTPVSTFSTDVDTASYSNARRFLQAGQRPPADAIRVEEFVNYFDYQLTGAPSLAEPIRMETELMNTPWNDETQLLRVSLQAYRSELEQLPPLNLVFLLDVSGSMHNPDKLPLMQRSFNLLVDQLRPQDHVAIVVYAGASGVVLEPTSGDAKQKINNAINSLRAGGSTHGSAGIELAYSLAQEHFSEQSINRVILGTDGDFNVGTTSIEALKDLIETKRESGVFLNVLGFGTGNYNDYLMEELSNHGNGVAYYIDSYQEARKIFADQLTATLQTVAKDVKIQIEFNPQQVAEYRLIGYDNRLLAREDFNNDKIDAGEMGSGHSVTALYEIVPQSSAFRFVDPLRFAPQSDDTLPHSEELAFVKVRYKLPNEHNSQLMSIPVSTRTLEHPSDAMQLSSTVAGFAELLRNSPYSQTMTYDELIAAMQPTLENDRWGYRQELIQLMRNIASQQGN